MIPAPTATLGAFLALSLLGASPGASAAPEARSAVAEIPVANGRASDGATGDEIAGDMQRDDGLEALVPEVAAHPYRLEPGVRPFRHRLSFSPAFGYLGSERLFSLRAAYSPNPWLAYEGALGHNPGQSVHAVLHTLSAIVRRPMAGRFQPYLSGGYGMILVFPGQSLNADPVTKNALSFGGGLEFYIRSDLALRVEIKTATVFGRQGNDDGMVAFNYLQETIGLAFYRSISP